MWYVKNEAVKIFLYYMRGRKKFLCNISYMISHNLVKKLLVRYCIHSYMAFTNPFKKALG